MKTKIVSISNNSAVIVVPEASIAYVVDLDVLPSKRVGDEFAFTRDMAKKATPYGIDLSVIFPKGISLDIPEIQKQLFSQGIFSLSDLKKNPSAISQILLHMVNALGAEMYYRIKIVMEDYNDNV